MSAETAGRPPADGGTRTLYAGQRARKDVAKYLLEGEEPIIATRRHWAVLLWPTVKTVLVVVLGGWLLTAGRDFPLIRGLGLLVVLAGPRYLGLRLAEWYMRHFIVSPRRMLLTSGVIARTVARLPRRRSTAPPWQEPLSGRRLGYAPFRIDSAGQAQALSRVTYLPR